MNKSTNSYLFKVGDFGIGKFKIFFYYKKFNVEII